MIASEKYSTLRNLVLLFSLIVVILSGCSRSSQTQAATSFLPPTAEASPTDRPVAAVTPTVNTECTNVLSFMEDITIPDGEEVKPGAELDKRWQVRNNGTCDWNDQYTVRLISGIAMGSPQEQTLYPARSGSAAIIRAVLTAPSEPGTYRSAWQAYNPAGEPFGDPFYIEIIVKE